MADIRIFLILAAVLFAAGLTLVVTRRHPIIILVGIELMLNAANLNLVAFSRLDAGRAQGQIFSLFVMLVAACEAAVVLALLYVAVRKFARRQTLNAEGLI